MYYKHRLDDLSILIFPLLNKKGRFISGKQSVSMLLRYGWFAGISAGLKR
ncbi:MAG: hypothetical protein ABH858_03500 [Candidatus Omnitrophota bacterium]